MKVKDKRHEMALVTPLDMMMLFRDDYDDEGEDDDVRENIIREFT